MIRRLLDRIFNGPSWRTFILMGAFGGLFAVTSYNLLMLFTANFHLIATYGLMSALDGAALQLVELIVLGYLSLAFYILFKGCLYGLLGHFMKH